MNDLVYIGFITGPFGLKGELKLSSDSNHLDKIFREGNKFYIDNQEYVLKKYHFHKTHLVTFAGYDDINKINDFLKKEVYISKKDLHLQPGEYLYVELLGCKIIDSGKELGIVEDLLCSKNGIFIKCGNLIIPLIDKYLEKVDTSAKIIYVKGSGELIL
ncbi:MAG: 16S rRNA processing protein RimM [Firmicutes bacterium]|nr:16S rRNA processing protein RimM [Bacillota bacterium]